MGLKDNWKFYFILTLGVISCILFFIANRSEPNTSFFFSLAALIFLSLFILAVVFGGIYYVADKIIKKSTEKKKFTQGLATAFFIFACMILLCFFYYVVSLFPSSLQFMKDGVTAGVSAVIGGLACESIIRLK